MPDESEDLAVTRNDDAGRYEIHVGEVLGGFTEFRPDREGRLVFPHTEIDPAFAGRGLGSVLVRRALEDLVARGETIVPLCPYVVRFLQKHEIAGLEIAWPKRVQTGGGGV